MKKDEFGLEDEENDIEAEELAKAFYNATKLLQEARKHIKRDNKTYYFTCPLCGGEAHAGRASTNGHIHTRCEDCKTALMQ